MALADNYNEMRSTIFNQRIEGTYVKRRPSDSFKLLLALGIANIALGLSALFTYLNTFNTSLAYNEDLQALVYLPKGTSHLYIDIGGLYQNYLSYTKSINYDQLEGKTLDLKLADTKPYDYNGDLSYYPAGAIAATFFQDKIAFEELEIETNDISWKSERSLIGFSSYIPQEISIPDNWTGSTSEGTIPLNTTEGSGLPILNERFANWISLAAFSNFKKLWGKIEVPENGNYNLRIESIYDLSDTKGVLLTQSTILGIPNYAFAIGIIAIGVFSIISAYGLKLYDY